MEDKFRLLRNVFFVFTNAVTLTLLMFLILGISLCNRVVLMIFILCAIYAVLSLMLFLDCIISRVNFVVLEITYVTLINVIYIVVGHIMNIKFSDKTMYIYTAVGSVVIFLIVRWIMLKVDQEVADQINDLLDTYKQKKKKTID